MIGISYMAFISEVLLYQSSATGFYYQLLHEGHIHNSCMPQVHKKVATDRKSSFTVGYNFVLLAEKVQVTKSHEKQMASS